MDMDAAYREHAQAVYAYALSLCHDAHLAQDLTEDTFLRAMRTLSQWKGDCALLTWLCAITRRLFADVCKRRARQGREPPGETLPQCAELAPEQSLLREERYLSLMQRIHALEPEAREVVYLRAMGELRFARIGEIMGRSENWARVTYYRAKERIKKEMNDDEYP